MGRCRLRRRTPLWSLRCTGGLVIAVVFVAFTTACAGGVAAPIKVLSAETTPVGPVVYVFVGANEVDMVAFERGPSGALTGSVRSTRTNANPITVPVVNSFDEPLTGHVNGDRITLTASGLTLIGTLTASSLTVTGLSGTSTLEISTESFYASAVATLTASALAVQKVAVAKALSDGETNLAVARNKFAADVATLRTATEAVSRPRFNFDFAYGDEQRAAEDARGGAGCSAAVRVHQAFLKVAAAGNEIDAAAGGVRSALAAVKPDEHAVVVDAGTVVSWGGTIVPVTVDLGPAQRLELNAQSELDAVKAIGDATGMKRTQTRLWDLQYGAGSDIRC
jgi:hypothetical protein